MKQHSPRKICTSLFDTINNREEKKAAQKSGCSSPKMIIQNQGELWILPVYLRLERGALIKVSIQGKGKGGYYFVSTPGSLKNFQRISGMF